MNDQHSEALIKERGADVAPRVTREQIEALIVSESCFTAADGVRGASTGKPGENLLPEYVTHPGSPLSLVTFCVLVLRNGHRIVGVNEGPVSASNFDAELGRKLARDDAIDKVWPLEGYLLKQMLHVASI